MDKNINEFLGSLQNSIEQKKKKLRLDETVIMKMYKSYNYHQMALRAAWKN